MHDPDEPGESERVSIEARLAEIARIKQEAVSNGHPRATVLLPRPRRSRRTDTAERVQEAAAGLVAEGFQPTPRAIAARIGQPAASVSSAICRLRQAKDWPYGRTEPGLVPGEVGRREASVDPLERLVEAIGERVLAYLVRRIEGRSS